ncbi:MAG: hypothetical protein GX661_05105 [Acholeplasmataceae bacterium]|nr:hypothetical protein [Acholeplasmataceae bacterium]
MEKGKATNNNFSYLGKLRFVEDDFQLFEIEMIKYNEYILKFNSPISLKCFADGQGFYCDYDELDIHCYGKSSQELLENFSEDIVIAWKIYIECDQKVLSAGALAMREHLLKLLKRL